MKTHRYGTTLIEILIAASLLTLVLAMALQLMRIINGSSGASLENLTQRVLLNQEGTIGLEKLYNRLQEGIEIIAPIPGKTSHKLVFRDILNHTVTLKVAENNPGVLVSMCEKSKPPSAPETGRGCPANEKTETNGVGNSFFPAPPVQIKNVKSVSFTALSATCIQVSLVLSQNNAEVPVDVMIQMKNSGLVYQQ